MSQVVVVGAGGFGRDVAQFVRDVFGADQLKGFIDDDPMLCGDADIGAPLLGTIAGYSIERDDCFVIAVATPDLRRRLVDHIRARSGRFVTLIHPRAYVIPSAQIGEGCVIGPFATIGSRARLGEQVVLTYGASVGHDAEIGPCSVLSPYATTNGFSVLGPRAFLGTQAIVNPGKEVGEGAKVAAASVVYRNVPAGHLAMGNPAKSRPLLAMRAPATFVAEVATPPAEPAGPLHAADERTFVERTGWPT